MEFFIPGLLLFLVSIAVTFIFVPRFTPLITALLAIGFLTYGVYDHYKMFASEYRLSTWQDSLKIYAPAVMIGAIIIFIIYAILAFFTGGSVPVPQLPNIPEPSVNTATSQITQSINKIGNILSNTTNNVVNKINNTVNATNKNVTNNRTNNKNKNNLSRSFLETI